MSDITQPTTEKTMEILTITVKIPLKVSFVRYEDKSIELEEIGPNQTSSEIYNDLCDYFNEMDQDEIKAIIANALKEWT